MLYAVAALSGEKGPEKKGLKLACRWGSCETMQRMTQEEPAQGQYGRLARSSKMLLERIFA
jgi:hypothetical protein